MAKKVYGTPNPTPPIEISGNMKVKTLKEQFKANCGLTLRVYKLDGTLADDNQNLAEIRAGAKATDAICHMRSISKVKSVAIFYKRELGLIVDVFSADDTELPNQNVTLKAALEGKFDEEPKAKSVNVSGEVDTDNIETFEDDNGKYGFRDKTTGKVVIEPKYDYAEDFEDGTAYVELEDFEDGWNRIDINENIIEHVIVYEPDADGYAIAKFEGKYGIVDEEENEIIPFIHDSSDDLVGYIDEVNGRHIENGYIRRKIDGKWGMFDLKGNEVIPCKYDYVGYVDYELYVFALQLDGKWGYGYEEDGKIYVSVPCKYDELWREDYDLLKVKLDGEEFFINYNDERV